MRNFFSKNKIDFNAFFLGLFLAITYKYWKIFCVKISHSYEADQLLFSIFRFGASVFSYYIIKKNYQEFRGLFLIKKPSQFFILIFLYLISVFIFYDYFLNGFNFFYKSFFFEFFINSFVGIFEELLFRGLLFLSIRRHLGFVMSALVSALLFTSWHFDVVDKWIQYYDIFSFAILACVLLESGFSFSFLIMIHAIRDTIHYGFEWNDVGENLSPVFHIGTLDMIFVVIFILFIKKYFKNNN